MGLKISNIMRCLKTFMCKYTYEKRQFQNKIILNKINFFKTQSQFQKIINLQYNQKKKQPKYIMYKQQRCPRCYKNMSIQILVIQNVQKRRRRIENSQNLLDDGKTATASKQLNYVNSIAVDQGEKLLRFETKHFILILQFEKKIKIQGCCWQLLVLLLIKYFSFWQKLN
ncbi:hypothetical protein pb186bvf_018656 [Paramecium bursaria]